MVAPYFFLARPFVGGFPGDYGLDLVANFYQAGPDQRERQKDVLATHFRAPRPSDYQGRVRGNQLKTAAFYQRPISLARWSVLPEFYHASELALYE